MRLGNAAVDDCSSQGLPDFYFFSRSLSLSLSLFFFPCFFLSLARPFYFAPRVPFAPSFLFIASRPTTQEGARRRRCGGGGGGGGRRGSHRNSYLLLSLFPLFSSPPAANDAVAAFFRRSLLLLLLPFFFHFSFSLTRYASPRPTATLPTFQPLEQQFIFIAMFHPLLTAPIPNLLLSPHPRPTLVLEFFLSVLLLRSFVSFLSFFLSFRAAHVAHGQ